MAKITVCDICGDACNEYSGYKLIQKRAIFAPKEKDICHECIDKIKESIRTDEANQEIL